MCGRFLISEPAVDAAKQIAEMPQWVQEQLRLGEKYPSSQSLIIEKQHERLTCTLMPFGVESSSSSRRIINARAETVREKWMFRSAWKHRRCAAPCSMFYEWSALKEKTGFFLPDETMFLGCIAIEDQFVILTRPAGPAVAPVHHRMPVVLRRNEVAAWIEEEEKAWQYIERDRLPLEQTSETLRLF